MTEGYTPDVDDKTFEGCQIGKGLKPLAQHGTVVFGANGVLTLLGTKGDVLDSAPLGDVSAKRIAITGGQTVSLKLGDRKYNVSGKNGPAGAIGTAKKIVDLVNAQGK
jgi:hypothetical protein